MGEDKVIDPRWLRANLYGQDGGCAFGKTTWECFAKQFIPDYIGRSIITPN